MVMHNAGQTVKEVTSILWLRYQYFQHGAKHRVGGTIMEITDGHYSSVLLYLKQRPLILGGMHQLDLTILLRFHLWFTP